LASTPPAEPGGTAFNPETPQVEPGFALAGRNLELTGENFKPLGASSLKIEPGLRKIKASRRTFKPGRSMVRAGRLNFDPGDAPGGLKSKPAGLGAPSETARGERRILESFGREGKSPQAGFRRPPGNGAILF
jgi:hypothetical protein